MSFFNEDNYFKSKSNNNFVKQNELKTTEGFNNYKHCLPSFLLDDYFQDKTSEDSEDKEDEIKKNNSFNNIKEENKIFSDFNQKNSFNSIGKIENNMNNRNIKLNNFNNNYNNNIYNTVFQGAIRRFQKNFFPILAEAG